MKTFRVKIEDGRTIDVPESSLGPPSANYGPWKVGDVCGLQAVVDAKIEGTSETFRSSVTRVRGHIVEIVCDAADVAKKQDS